MAITEAKVGKHSNNNIDYDSIIRLLDDFLKFCRLEDINFKIRIQKSIRGTNHSRVISVTSYNRSGIFLEVQPGGNDSRRRIILFLPREYSGRAEELFLLLRKKSEEFSKKS